MSRPPSSPALPHPPSDHALAGWAATERAAFAELYRRYLPTLYRYALARLGNVQEAEDVTAQSFEAAMKSLSRYSGRSSLSTWLVGIARHKVADRLRRLRPTVPLHMAEALPDPAADRAVRAAECAELLRRLPPERAEVLALRFYAGLSVAETAQLMGRSEGAIKMLTLRAIEQAQALAALDDKEGTV